MFCDKTAGNVSTYDNRYARSCSSYTPPSTNQLVFSVAVTIDHSKLSWWNPKSIHQFKSSYDQTNAVVITKAQRPIVYYIGLEVFCAVDLKFYVDIEYLKATAALGLIPSISSCEE